MIKQNDVEVKTPVPFWGSTRVFITFIAFIGMVFHCAQRTNMSIAIVCMVNHTAIGHHQPNRTGSSKMQISENCIRTTGANHTEGPYAWNKEIQGIILCAYFGGFILTQIPGGYLAAKYSARFMFSGAMCISSLSTILMPFAASIHWILFATFQGIIGLAHGTIWPCTVVIMAHWAPVSERGKLVGFMNAGAQIGNVLTLSVGGLMCSWRVAGGWSLIFYYTGTIGLMWALLWIIVFRDSPSDHTFISAREKQYILENTPHARKKSANNNDKNNNYHAPWRAMLTSSACWALFVFHTCNNWGTYTFLTSVPKYMDEALGFDIKSNGFFSASLYVLQWFNINLSGFIADMLIFKKILTTTQTRKLFNALGSVIPSIFILALIFMTCETKYVAATLLVFGIGTCGFCLGGGFPLVPNDMAPAYSGIIFGISNTLGTIPGIVSPYIVGALTERDPNNWITIFIISIIIFLTGCSVFLLFGSCELQPWAIQHKKDPAVCDDLLSSDDNKEAVKQSINTVE